MTACIVGWAHTPFGRLDGETVESLIVRVANGALADAGIAARDVDEIVLGHFNAGFSAQDFTASLVLQASPDLRFKRALRVENACATGSAAVHQGLKSIAARSARIVLVVGVEQMTTTPGPEIGRNLLKASYVREEADIDGGFAGIFGKIADIYFQRWGDQSDALARIAAKNHKNGVGNPYAQLRKDLGLRVLPQRKREESARRRSAQAHRLLARFPTAPPRWCWPMSRPRSSSARRSRSAPPSTCRISCRCRGATCSSSRAARVAWKRALAQAGVALSDLSFVETHDCFTIAELIEYEAMGLVPEGQGARAIAEGIVAEGRRAADQSVRRPQGQGPSDRRDRRLHACARRHAAHRHAPATCR